MKRVAAVGKKLWPVVKVIYRDRKTELALLLAAEGLARQILQAIGH